jgi:hypothetical protein
MEYTLPACFLEISAGRRICLACVCWPPFRVRAPAGKPPQTGAPRERPWVETPATSPRVVATMVRAVAKRLAAAAAAPAVHFKAAPNRAVVRLAALRHAVGEADSVVQRQRAEPVQVPAVARAPEKRAEHASVPRTKPVATRAAACARHGATLAFRSRVIPRAVVRPELPARATRTVASSTTIAPAAIVARLASRNRIHAAMVPVSVA